MAELVENLKSLWLISTQEIGAAVRSTRLAIAGRWHDRKTDLRLGIDSGKMRPASLASRHADSYGYDPSPYSHLEFLASLLPLGGEDVFFDVGCGRGRVVCFMAGKGARKAVGVEIVEDLAADARANAAAVAARGGGTVEILQCDAAAIPPAALDEGTVFYLFSPFGFRTLRDFVDALEGSLRRRPRRATVVYYVPTHRWYLDDRPWLVEDSRFSRALDVMIWRSRPG